MESKGKKQPKSDGQSELARRFKQNPFIFIGTVVVLIIVIVAFVLVPAIPGVGGGGALTELNFGSWNKTPINYVPGNYFAQVVDNYSRYMQSSMDESNASFYNQMIWRQAFDETLVYTAMLDEMKQAGYSAPADVVDRKVAELPQFQDDNGRFSRAKYRQLTNAERLSLWRKVQDSLSAERYQEDVTSLRIPSPEAEFIAAMASPQRSFDMVSFPLDSYPDSEVTSYAEENAGLFRLTHLSKITITSSEKEAKKILKDIEDGTLTFEDAARNHSKDSYAEQGGDLGLKMVFELTNDIPDAQERDAAAALEAEKISPIIKLDDGWAFFRSEAASYPADLTDRSNLDKIRGYIVETERGRVEDWLIAEADTFAELVTENDFETALFFRGLEKKSFGPLPVNFGGSDLFTTLDASSISELNSASTYDNFWRTAFFTPVNTPSSPFVVGDNVVVLYPREEITAEETAVEEIKTKYNSYWLSNNAEQGLRSYFTSSPKLHDRFEETYNNIFIYGL